MLGISKKPPYTITLIHFINFTIKMLILPSAFFCPSRLLIPSIIMPLLHLHSPSPSSSSNPSSPSNLSSIPPTRLYSSSPALCAPPNLSSISFQVASCSALKVIRRSAESFTSLTAFKMQSKSGTAHSSSFSTSSSSTQVISVSDSEGTVKEVIGKSPVVSVSWLHQHLRDPNLKVLDASWYMPAEKRNPLQEFKGLHIPGSLFFDLEAISDVTSDLPHMLPSEGAFSAAMSALGITNEDAVIIYDGNGIFSAARVWWMFRVFGHKNVSVLDGGLPQWCQFGFPLDTVTSQAELEKIEAAALAVKNFYQGQQVPTGNFKASLQKDLVWSSEQVMKNLEDGTFQHIDARSKARFDGVAPEPRKGIRAGHVPGSKCIPFSEVLNDQGLLLGSEDLLAKFMDAEITLDSPIVASCGTGVTASILALALYRLGRHDVPVYDGSWTEWGALPDTPVATNCASNSS